MIGRRETERWAARFGVSAAQIERDHFISHALNALGALLPHVHFFGGTALCRTHLEETRLSEDIDLLHPEPRVVLADLARSLPRALRREYPETTSSPRADEGDGSTLWFATPDVTPIKVYVGRLGANTRAWEFEPTPVRLRYSDLPSTQIFSCPTSSTFAAMKLAAWSDRHTPRDLFDLAGLATIGALQDPAVDRIYRAKMGTHVIRTDFEHVPRSTAGAWVPELDAQVATLPAPDDALATVRAALFDR